MTNRKALAQIALVVVLLLSLTGGGAPFAAAAGPSGLAATGGAPLTAEFSFGSSTFSLLLSNSPVTLTSTPLVLTSGDAHCPTQAGEVMAMGMIEGHPANLTRVLTDKNGNKIETWCIKGVLGAGFFVWRYIDKATGNVYYISDCAFDGGQNSWDFTTAGGVFTGFTNNNTKPGTTKWNFWSYNVATNTLTLTKHNDGNPNKVLTFKPPPNNATLANGIAAQGCDACETINSQTEAPAVAGLPGVPEFGAGAIAVAAVTLVALAIIIRVRGSRSGTGLERRPVPE